MIRYLLLFAALCTPFAAHAQRQQSGMGFRLGQEVKDHREVGDEMKAEEMLLVTARCLADDKPDAVRTYLKAVPASEEEARAFEKLQKPLNRCIPEMDFSGVGNMVSARGTRTLSFDHGSLRGALAEGLMREEQIVLDPTKMTLGDDGMYVAEMFHGERSSDLTRVFALGFAGCVMGHNPSAFEQLMGTGAGSPEERAAIIAMADSFSQCVMEGQTLSLNASTLRNQMAEVAYYANMIGAEPDA